MLMHHGHVPVHVCTISMLWNFHTNPYQSDEQQTTGAGETSITTNYQLHGKDWTNRAPVAENLIKHGRQTCPCTTQNIHTYILPFDITQSLAEASQCMVYPQCVRTVRISFFFIITNIHNECDCTITITIFDLNTLFCVSTGMCGNLISLVSVQQRVYMYPNFFIQLLPQGLVRQRPIV